MNDFFKDNCYESNKIDSNKPVLIRIGSGFNKNIHEPNNKKIRLDKTFRMSNPCFFVNNHFVNLFLDNCFPISFTSDMFIHKKLIDLNPTAGIQHFSIIPSPIYELSWGSKKNMKSLIRDI